MNKRILKSLRWRPLSDVAKRAYDQLREQGCSEAEALVQFHAHVQKAGKRPSPAELEALTQRMQRDGPREVGLVVAVLARWTFPEDEGIRLFVGTWAAGGEPDPQRVALAGLAIPVVLALPASELRDDLVAKLRDRAG